MSGGGRHVTDDQLRIVPANEASWEDLQAVIGTADAGLCQCQRFKLQPQESFRSFPAEQRASRLRAQTNCGHPESRTTSGLVGYLDGEPAGWCAVEPRSAYEGLLRVYRVPWAGREEDKTDGGVWAVTCLIVRKGFRGCRVRGGEPPNPTAGRHADRLRTRAPAQSKGAEASYRLLIRMTSADWQPHTGLSSSNL
jgi:hypothetical protein